ncbi:hypothetical protein BB427_11340 [Pseudoalteromonas sp. BMB]|uniref:hypothetical protein n=1 Tax=Pseudoalteromonas sp. BMB TaxID=1874619 RepID=UPI00083CD0F5|nr:hypothetical protein [Pseudoalteromonas sp. BMB]ODB41078.1 hypothetical protein BB427_11340 [Pseudoalteromonas sp. BMB]
MQPINGNDKLSNENTLYVAGSDGGKTSAVQKLGRIKPTDQVVFWDPHKSFKQIQGRVVRRYTTFGSFFKALRAGRATKQGFKIALTVPEERAYFLKFLTAVKGFGDGLHPKRLHVVCEEVPEVTETVGRDNTVFGWFMRIGRKYGFIMHCIGQRVVEMSKTITSQCPYKWVGIQHSLDDAKRMSKEIDVSLADIVALNKLEYYFKSPGMGNVVKSKLVFKKAA